jgi:hypothetical protein
MVGCIWYVSLVVVVVVVVVVATVAGKYHSLYDIKCILINTVFLYK